MHPKQLLIDDFSYVLPPERIAFHPLAERDASQLLHYRKGEIRTHSFRNLPALLPSPSRILFNNTRVMEARLLFQKSSGGSIEVFCLEPKGDLSHFTQTLLQQQQITYYCLVGGASKWKRGEVLEKKIPAGDEEWVLRAAITGKESNRFVIQFTWMPADKSFAEILEKCGTIPLPPYIKRKAESADRERYQTVYASAKGSVAAPTAGLHFTESLLDQLKQQKILPDYITLHVGAGTFQPVHSASLEQHHLHTEYFEVPLRLLEELRQLPPQLLTVVGTTTLRTLESLYWMGVKVIQRPGISANELSVTQWEPYDRPNEKTETPVALQALANWVQERKLDRLITTTQLLLAPGYRFRIAKRLITNFHQPRSTLLLLVAAAIGPDWKKVYQYALDHNFRFLSYGDSSLLEWD